jgi:hypothetical protein
VEQLLEEVKAAGAQEQAKEEVVHSNAAKRRDVPEFLINFKLEKL